jgi:adenine-specific DNA-methyltransferase
MTRMKMHTPDLTQENIARLAELFPNCITESRDEEGAVEQAIDFDLLRQELSDHIVEGPQERYHLNWPGKREALLAANAPIAKTLRPCREESVDFDTTKNLFIEGDNLDALKLLQETYLNKVKMIYIDPPYNTGSDFIYDDDFSDSSANYMLRSEQWDDSARRLVANTESNGRFHSDWLSMMYPRLRLARNLLADDGILFVSIDDGEVNALKQVMSEVFGETNFLGQITVVSNLKGRSDDRYFATAHNYLLAYSKGGFASLGVPIPEEYLESYPDRDDDGRPFRLQGLRKRGAGARREDRPNMHYAFYANAEDGTVALEQSATHSIQILPALSDGSAGRWRWGRDTAKARVTELAARPVGKEARWDVFQVDYAYQDDGLKRIRPKSIWMGSEFANEAGTLQVKKLIGSGVFETPKPIGLVRYMLQQSLNDGVVLDFFAGSGTTGHAVMEYAANTGNNISYVLVQASEKCGEASGAAASGFTTVADIAKARLKNAGAAVKSAGGMHAEGLDVGFRVLKIDSSNMKDVYYRPDQATPELLGGHIDNIKDDRTDEDLLFQVLLDWGVDLALPIRQETIAGQPVYFVDDNALCACFATGIDEEFVKQLAARKPLRAVFRDASYRGDDVKINVEQIFRQMSPGTEVRTL